MSTEHDELLVLLDLDPKARLTPIVRVPLAAPSGVGRGLVAVDRAPDGGLVEAVRDAPDWTDVPGFEDRLARWGHDPGVCWLAGGAVRVVRGALQPRSEQEWLLDGRSQDAVARWDLGGRTLIVRVGRGRALDVLELHGPVQDPGASAWPDAAELLDGLEPRAWLEELCRAQRGRGCSFGAAASLGTACRLYRPVSRADRAAWMARVRSGRGLSERLAELVSGVEVPALEAARSRLCLEVDDALRQLDTLVQRAHGGAQDLAEPWLRLRHGRDDVEAAAAALAAAGPVDPGRERIRQLDRAIAVQASLLGDIAPGDHDERLAEVAASEPAAWWGQPE